MTDRLQRLAAGGDQDAAAELFRVALRRLDAQLVARTIALGFTPPPEAARLAAFHVGGEHAWATLAALPPPPRCAVEAQHLTRLAISMGAGRFAIKKRTTQLLSRSGQSPDVTSCNATYPRYWVGPGGARQPIRWGRVLAQDWIARCVRIALDKWAGERPEIVAPFEAVEGALLRAGESGMWSVIAPLSINWWNFDWPDPRFASAWSALLAIDHLKPTTFREAAWRLRQCTTDRRHLKAHADEAYRAQATALAKVLTGSEDLPLISMALEREVA